MSEIKKTWDESLLERLSAFETYLEEIKDKIYEEHAELINNLVELVELSKKLYEPGMDYYGTDYLTQMGVGLKVKEIEGLSDPVVYENKLEELLEDSKRRLRNMRSDVQEKEKQYEHTRGI